jgi:hypothetical protein
MDMPADGSEGGGGPLFGFRSRCFDSFVILCGVRNADVV